MPKARGLGAPGIRLETHGLLVSIAVETDLMGCARSAPNPGGKVRGRTLVRLR